jgi:hypothetical protein
MAEVLRWYPPVGVFIGILGLLGIVVPLVRDLATMGKWEKAGWTLVMFVLMGLELRSIYMDRRDHEEQQAAARAEQLQHFKEVGDGITKAITTSQAEFAATMKRSDDILSGIGESLNIQSGGDSYAYVQMSPLGTGDFGFELYIIQDGNHHLLNVFGSVIDLDKLDSAFKTGQVANRSIYEIGLDRMPILYRGRAVFVGTYSTPGDTSDYKRFNISLSANNGLFSELYRLKRVNGKWITAMMVQVAYYDQKGHGRVACTRVDKDFPSELLAKDLDWVHVAALPKFHIKDGRTCAQ